MYNLYIIVYNSFYIIGESKQYQIVLTNFSNYILSSFYVLDLAHILRT